MRSGGLDQNRKHRIRIDPETYGVSADRRWPGQEVVQKRTQHGKQFALSFRPSKALFKDGSIGDYVLLQPGEGIRRAVEYPIHVRLQVSDPATPDFGRLSAK